MCFKEKGIYWVGGMKLRVQHNYGDFAEYFGFVRSLCKQQLWSRFFEHCLKVFPQNPRRGWVPYLKSHLRPQFVIFNAALKLRKAVQEQKDLIEGSPDLMFLMDLYMAWILGELPDNHEQDQSYFPPAHDNNDKDDGWQWGWGLRLPTPW